MSSSSISDTSKESSKSEGKSNNEESEEVLFSIPNDTSQSEVQRSEEYAEIDIQHNAQALGKEDNVNKNVPTALTVTGSNKN
eukprot:9682689-Ditylum_brightwellii.AAC.1